MDQPHQMPFVILGLLLLHTSYMTYRTINTKNSTIFGIITNVIELTIPVLIGVYWCKFNLRLLHDQSSNLPSPK